MVGCDWGLMVENMLVGMDKQGEGLYRGEVGRVWLERVSRYGKIKL
jgi:hypothetical protein